jgi:TatD DNase family protein
LARVCNERGWFLSFAGTLTFKNAENLRRALAVAEPSRVLVETDSPFLTPHPYRGRPNASYMVPYTVRSMAEVLDSDLAELCSRISENTVEAYGNWE